MAGGESCHVQQEAIFIQERPDERTVVGRESSFDREVCARKQTERTATNPIPTQLHLGSIPAASRQHCGSRFSRKHPDHFEHVQSCRGAPRFCPIAPGQSPTSHRPDPTSHRQDPTSHRQYHGRARFYCRGTFVVQSGFCVMGVLLVNAKTSSIGCILE